jgi:hypothetical protein
VDCEDPLEIRYTGTAEVLESLHLELKWTISDVKIVVESETNYYPNMK